eukprot:TRINITY_DN40616_c0_g1_i1.p1 TRINITY_DN40616_c0_g1~~TRINITY_DN40616_c0_g1_i1.p1  ORF type:complete len:175 (-),score=36.08 TRINITY_DN40616_c0_g1_i1:123-647(-)
MSDALSFIEAIGEDQREGFLHAVVDDVCGREPDYGSRFGVSGTNPKFQGMLQAWKQTFLSTAGSEEPRIGEEVPEAYRQLAQQVFVARKPDLELAVGEAAARVTTARLTDVDWKLNLMLASDKMGALREPRVLLNLGTELADGSEQQVRLEMSKQELDHAIKMLSQAEAVMKDL